MKKIIYFAVMMLLICTLICSCGKENTENPSDVDETADQTDAAETYDDASGDERSVFDALAGNRIGDAYSREITRAMTTVEMNDCVAKYIALWEEEYRFSGNVYVNKAVALGVMSDADKNGYTTGIEARINTLKSVLRNANLKQDGSVIQFENYVDYMDGIAKEAMNVKFEIYRLDGTIEWKN